MAKNLPGRAASFLEAPLTVLSGRLSESGMKCAPEIFATVEFSATQTYIKLVLPAFSAKCPELLFLFTGDTIAAVFTGCHTVQMDPDEKAEVIAARRGIVFSKPVSPGQVPFLFHAARAEIDGLREWIGLSVYGFEHASGKVSTDLGGVTCTIEPSLYKHREYLLRSEEVTATARFESTESNVVDYWIDHVTWLSSAISLFAGTPCPHRRIMLESHIGLAELWLPSFEGAGNEIEDPRIWPYSLRGKDLSRASSIVSHWFAAKDRARILSGMFIEGWLHPATVLESQYSSMLQGVESYHRRRFPSEDRYISQEEYGAHLKVMIAAIPDSLPPDHREALKSRLKFGNEHSLRKRLSGLLAAHPQLERLVTLFSPSSKAKDWVNVVVDMRNELTHYSGSYAFFEREFRNISTRLQQVRIAAWFLLLYEALGGDGAKALEILSHTQDLQELLSRPPTAKEPADSGRTPDTTSSSAVITGTDAPAISPSTDAPAAITDAQAATSLLKPSTTER